MKKPALVAQAGYVAVVNICRLYRQGQRAFVSPELALAYWFTKAQATGIEPVSLLTRTQPPSRNRTYLLGRGNYPCSLLFGFLTDINNLLTSNIVG